MKKAKIKTVLAFIAAVLTTHLLASVVGTQLVLADILGFGLDVSLADRLSATLHDILGVAPVLLLLISLTFLVAFMIAALCYRFLHGNRTWWYLAAGFSSLPATLMLIKLFMGVTLFAAARTTSGMLLVALCGLAGGLLFARLTQSGLTRTGLTPTGDV